MTSVHFWVITPDLWPTGFFWFILLKKRKFCGIPSWLKFKIFQKSTKKYPFSQGSWDTTIFNKFV